MKKIYSAIVAFIATFALSSCGGGLGTMGQAGAASNTEAPSAGYGNILGNLISTFASGIMTNQSSLVGTWTYAKPCVQFESENLLAQAGGAVAASKTEEKLATYYQFVGIKPGAFTFTFTKDGKCQYTVGQRTMTGTYSFIAEKKQVIITTQTGINVTAYVSISINQLGLTFDASKLLQLASGFGGQTSQLGLISSLAGSFTGMKIGFAFNK